VIADDVAPTILAVCGIAAGGFEASISRRCGAAGNSRRADPVGTKACSRAGVRAASSPIPGKPSTRSSTARSSFTSCRRKDGASQAGTRRAECFSLTSAVDAREEYWMLLAHGDGDFEADPP